MTNTLLIRKVGVGSLGKLIGTVNAVIGVIVGSLGSIVATAGVITNNDYNVLTDVLAGIAIVLIGVVIYPLVLFLLGWLYGALVAIVLNFVVGVSGGLELTVDETPAPKLK